MKRSFEERLSLGKWIMIGCLFVALLVVFGVISYETAQKRDAELERDNVQLKLDNMRAERDFFRTEAELVTEINETSEASIFEKSLIGVCKSPSVVPQKIKPKPIWRTLDGF